MNCTVIIPVGPGHEEIHQQALESVRVAALKPGPFKKIYVNVIDDTLGQVGRSAARNKAVSETETEWIFFLDADDRIHPEALESVAPYLNDYDAVWGNILEIQDGICVWRYQVPEIKSFKELISFDPYVTIGPMGHFVRSEVAKKLPFDVDMDCGEDWDFYLREWKGFRCIKIRDPVIINYRQQHSTGPRSATGRDWMEVVHPMIALERGAMRGNCREYWLEGMIKEYSYKKGAELGVKYGRMSRHLMLTCKDLSLIGVDSWEKKQAKGVEDEETYEEWDMDALEKKARICESLGDVTFIKATTHEASKDVKDGSLDFVFIDAGHDYESVKQDFIDWEPKVRKGGLVSGHDSDMKSVKRVLEEYAPNHKLAPDNVWYYIK